MPVAAHRLRILGIDPGTRLTGYGVIDVPSQRVNKPDLIDGGVIRLDGNAELLDRLEVLDRELRDVLAEHRPDVMAVEKVFGHGQFPQAGIVMAHARGIILLAARHAGVRVVELTPNKVKRSLVGFGHATKEQMQRAIQAQWDLPEPPSPPDVADALAVALCCGRTGAA